MEAKKEEETFSVNYKYHHNWNISNVLNAADLLCRVIFIYTYLCNIPVQFEALINITCVEKVLCHLTFWVVYRLNVINTLKDHILINVLQILIMPQHV